MSFLLGAAVEVLDAADTMTQFTYSNREVYIAIALCRKVLHSAIAI
jgi:hypothetical protein